MTEYNALTAVADFTSALRAVNVDNLEVTVNGYRVVVTTDESYGWSSMSADGLTYSSPTSEGLSELVAPVE